MLRWLPIFAATLALAGCKTLDRDRDRTDKDRPPPGDTASRTKPKSDHWLDGPQGTATGRNDLPPKDTRPGPPPSDSTADPRDPGFDVRSEVKSVLAGSVIDPDGRPVRDVFIEVEPADRTAGGAPVGVQTTEKGYFLIKGLKPGVSYVLTAKAARDGQSLAGQVYATPPNVYVKLPLVEGLTLPNVPKGSDLPKAGGSLPPPLPLDSPTAENPRPTPQPLPVDTPPPPQAPVRPDLVTDGPAPGFRPPTTTIPPPTRDTPSVLPPSPSGVPTPQTQSKAIKPKSEFVLVDTTGRTRDFPSGRPDDLVLLDFMTTTCVPCKKAVPALKDLQRRYGARGFEVVGVLCDDATEPQRRAMAAAYQRQNELNYLVYTEPSSRPGGLMKKFEVEWFPTLILLNGSGEVVWRGDSRSFAELDGVLRSRLGQ